MSKRLEPRIATLLPCDTRVIASIEEVSRASDARVSALQAYFEQAATVAAEAVQRAQDSSKDSNTEFLKTELAETAEQRAGIETQIAPFSTADKARRDFAPAESDLRQIEVILDQRALAVNKQMALEAPRQEGARNLTAVYRAREAAFKELSGAHADEAAAWRAYYSARLARAKAECSAVNPGRNQTHSPLPEQVSANKGDDK